MFYWLSGLHREPDQVPNFQFAALPYRRHAENAPVEVMLITSRDTGRWVVPKGWPTEREAAWDCAIREAREEAGLVGEIDKRPIGSYHYKKLLDSGLPVWCTVEVFPLAVAGGWNPGPSKASASAAGSASTMPPTPWMNPSSAL